MRMRSSNPVLTRAFPTQGAGYAPGGYSPGYAPPGTEPGWAPPGYQTADRLTIDDVVIHTAGLLALVMGVAAVTWIAVPLEVSLGLAMPAALIALGIVLWTSFKRRGHVSPAIAISYAVVEGVFLGAISKAYNEAFGGGIVMQALVATAAVFFGMLALYQARIIRATPKMRKFLYVAMMGIFLTYMASFVMRLFGAEMPLLNDNSGLGILVSLAIVGVAAFMLILDFDQVETAIASGAPREFAWTAAFGLLVTIIWLYLELLRLLAKLQSRD
jgi:uncharacterized YccA/Bax inhibitor family protein